MLNPSKAADRFLQQKAYGEFEKSRKPPPPDKNNALIGEPQRRLLFQDRLFRARIRHVAELHGYSNPQAQLIVSERWLPPRGAFDPKPRKSVAWILLSAFWFAAWITTRDAASGLLLLVVFAGITWLWLWARL